MVVGFCGSGSMAGAMARGLRGEVDAMIFSDAGSGRAAELAAELGGEAVDSNRELAGRADVVVLAVKPAGLGEAAAELGSPPALVSLLGATPLAAVEAAFPGSRVVRVMPNVGVEVREGVLCVAGEPDAELRQLLGGLGHLIELADSQIDVATAVMGCAPAYFALAVEAISEAGAADGLDPALSRELVVEAMAGTASLLRVHPPADVRRAVASPGGSTEAGLEALERAGVPEGLRAAVRASLERMRG